MDAVEFSLKIFPLNDQLQQELVKLQAEGWQGVPGIAPAVTYVMFRNVAAIQPVQAPAPAGAGFGSISIDETKVHVYRNGQLAGEK